MSSKDKKSYITAALPIIFLVTVFLFLIRGSAVKTGLDNFFWYTGNGYDGDIYTYFRMKVFIVLTIISVVYMIISVLSGSAKIYKNKVYIPMAVYAVFVLISYMAAEYKQVALIGFNERYEGTFVLIGYMLILFYAMNMLNNEKAFKAIFYAFSVACVLLGVWGVLQVFGIDINNLPVWLYIPSGLRSAADLSQKMGADAVRWFFSNQNYSSFFMIFPIAVSAMLVIANEKISMKIVFTVILALMLYSLWNAASLGGMVGLAAAGILGLVVFGKNLVKWAKSIVLIIVAIVISAGVSLPTIMGQVGSAMSENNMFSAVAYADDTPSEGLKYVDIDYIKTDGADIIFGFVGKEITIKTENDKLKGICDSDGKEIGNETEYMTVSEENNSDTGYNMITVKTANATWDFAAINGETWFASPSGQGIKLDKIESFGFKNSQSFATYRGYIWSRTIPLIKHTILIGHGADTFAIYFPQDDYAGRYNIGYYSDSQKIMIDKPHNMYLGAAVNTGVISLIALLAVFAMYLFDSFKIYKKCNYDSFIKYMGAGIFFAVFGFLVSGLVNDSTVQVMPAFYALLGTGFAMNRIIKEKK